MYWNRLGLLTGIVLLIARVAFGGEVKPVDSKMALEPRIIGSDSANLKLVEYFSFTCPHCARFHLDIYPKLKEKYIDTGQLQIEFRDFPLDQWALRAAALARCVPANFYEPMVGVLMKQQSRWIQSDDIFNSLVKIGQLAGLSKLRAETCMKDTKLLDGIVAMRMEGSQKYGVDTTPSFLHGTERIKAFEFEEFERWLDKKIE
ncbi:MAG: disulfide bond formation protein DsbA [Rhodospirillaceae bacterium]|nr:disulfide bond formation protein DsbA [Rhodospirillaceae bacterium]